MRLGAAIARGLAATGHAVVLHHNTSHDAAEALEEEINSGGGRAAAIAANLTDRGAAERLVAEAGRSFGPLTALVNNASQFVADTADSIDNAVWRSHFAMHVEAPVALSAAFASQLPADRTGNIVNMIDERVLRNSSEFFSYNLSKSALWTATRTMALHYAPRIRVNAVGPGPSLPERGQSEQAFAMVQRHLPLGHGPALDEFANTVLYFFNTSSVTGQMIALDGGRHLLGPELA